MQSDFLYLVEDELVEAREKHPGEVRSVEEIYREIYGRAFAFLFVQDQIDEFFREEARRSQDKSKILKDLIQVAAMCYRAAEDLQLLEVKMTQDFVNAAIAKHMPADVIPICNSAQEEDYYRELRIKSAYKEGEL